MDAAFDVAERFGRFARDDAPGRSAVYAEWASGVAADHRMCALLSRISATHRQPPLVFAVTRMLGSPEAGYARWAAWVHENADAVIDECGRRRLQTNEPLRCAALLPALAGILGPIALLEIGASAGLCLYPDRYSYRYANGPDFDPAEGISSVVLESEMAGGPELRLPEIVWRAGIDLQPLDAADPADRRFLETLVWPGENGRVERIRAALDLVAADPPLLVAGDATSPGVLESVAALAPAEATLVVTMPGVLPHIAREGRERLFSALAALEARAAPAPRRGDARRSMSWISIDPPGLHDRWRPAVEASRWGGFVLGRDGVPLAVVDPLGAFVEWRTNAEPSRR